MKKSITAALAVLIAAASLTGCAKEDSGLKKVGIIQQAEHPALDATYEGFVEGLKEAGFEDGVNIKYDFNNAQGDQSNCVSIASKLVNNKSDLILAIATPAAQAVAGKTTEIPTVITAVTDPQSSGLVESNKVPGGNITGTSDLTPVKEQIDLLVQILPDAEKIGVLYNSSETNSKFQADMAEEAIEAVGLEYIPVTVSNTNEIQSVVQSLVGKVDAIYIPTDNMIANGMSAVASVATENKIPIIVGEEGMCRAGGLATYGINYFNLGKQTGAMAAKILKGESVPSEMPIEYLTDCTLMINKTAADELGITIPQELLDKAGEILE